MNSFEEKIGNNSVIDTSFDLTSANGDNIFGSPLTTSSSFGVNSMCTDKISEAIRNNGKAIELGKENVRLTAELVAANAAIEDQKKATYGRIDELKQEKIELKMQTIRLQEKNETLNGQLYDLQERYRAEVMKLASTHSQDTKVF